MARDHIIKANLAVFRTTVRAIVSNRKVSGREALIGVFAFVIAVTAVPADVFADPTPAGDGYELAGRIVIGEWALRVEAGGPGGQRCDISLNSHSADGRSPEQSAGVVNCPPVFDSPEALQCVAVATDRRALASWRCETTAGRFAWSIISDGGPFGPRFAIIIDQLPPNPVMELPVHHLTHLNAR